MKVYMWVLKYAYSQTSYKQAASEVVSAHLSFDCTGTMLKCSLTKMYLRPCLQAYIVHVDTRWPLFGFNC